MGWLARVISTISTSRTAAQEQVALKDLKGWTYTQTEELISRAGFILNARKYVTKTKNMRWFIECKIDEWEKLLAAHSSDAAQEILSIFQNTRKELEILPFASEISLEDLLQLHKKLGGAVDSLFKQLKNSSFMHEYSMIDPENKSVVNPLYKELLDVNAVWQEFEQGVIRSGLHRMESITKRAAQLAAQHETLTRLAIKKNELVQRLENVEQRASLRKQDLEKLKEDPLYKDSISFNTARKGIIEQITAQKQEFLDFFSLVSSILTELIKLTPENELVTRYLAEPFETFTTDQGLRLVHIIQHCKALVASGRLQDSHERLERALTKISTNFLAQLHREHIVLQQQLSALELPRGSRDFMMKLQDAQYRCTHFVEQASRIEDEIAQIKERAYGVRESLGRDRQMFENLVRVALEKEIVVV